MTRTLSILGLSLALTAGCGNAPSNEYNAPVASLRGTITAASITTPQDLHVALVWDHFTENNGELKSAQEVGVRAEFPVHFQIDIATPPPAEALNTVSAADGAKGGFDPASFRFALGSVLVYEDDNGNGKLDLLALNATSFIDRPLGAAKEWIMYIEGTPPPASSFDGAQLAAGFNLVTDEPATCPTDGTDGIGGQSDCGPKLKVIPLSTDLSIALSNDPHLSQILCATGGGGVSSSGSSQAPSASGSGSGMNGGAGSDFTPPPAGAKITCAPDNRSFSADLCNQATLCSDTVCQSYLSQLLPGDPIPAGWPCPSI